MTPCCMAAAHDQACDCRARCSIRDRLLALAPHLHPSISRAAEWDQLRTITSGREGRAKTEQAAKNAILAEALRPAVEALIATAEQAGWSRAEALVAILSWTTTYLREVAGDSATRQTLESAILLLDE